MGIFCRWKETNIFLWLFVFGSVHVNCFTYPEEQFEEQLTTWPSTMTFHETKTNAMLGEALLKRLYSRIEHMENLFRLEMSQVYDKLKEDIHKNFRKCDRKRRRADSMKPQNLTSPNAAKKHQKRDKKRKKDKKPLIDERDFYLHD